MEPFHYYVGQKFHSGTIIVVVNYERSEASSCSIKKADFDFASAGRTPSFIIGRRGIQGRKFFKSEEWFKNVSAIDSSKDQVSHSSSRYVLEHIAYVVLSRITCLAAKHTKPLFSPN